MKKQLNYFTFLLNSLWVNILSFRFKTRQLSTVLNCIIFLLLLNTNTKGQTLTLTSNVTQICKGSAVTFTVNASSIPNAYQWSVSRDGGTNFSTIQNQSQSTFMIADMWLGILLLGVLGVLLQGTFHVVEKRVFAWYFASQGIK
jgi:hypothetical protein